MGMTIRVEVDDNLDVLEDALDEQLAATVGKVTAYGEKRAKLHLEQMVYAQPPAPSGYERTRNLIRGTKGKAAGTKGVVQSEAPYAYYVHEGVHHEGEAKDADGNPLEFRTPPRPYMAAAAKDAAKYAKKQLAADVNVEIAKVEV